MAKIITRSLELWEEQRVKDANLVRNISKSLERLIKEMHGKLENNIYIKHEDEQQQLRLGGQSWTINLEVLPEEAILIQYVTPLNIYVISRKDAFKYGFERKLGGERKLIVPIKHWQEGAVAIS